MKKKGTSEIPLFEDTSASSLNDEEKSRKERKELFGK
jgi:hypothetical protein